MNNKEQKTSTEAATGSMLFFLAAVILVMFVFLAYFNFNLFPEKERKLFTVKIYYQNGREAIKTFNLPASTKLSLVNNNYRNNLLSIWYHNDKPFGMEYGYLAMGVNDFDLVKVAPYSR